ncbi:MAG: C1 family peptidase, partial [Ginsengibacter sp.]
VCDEKIWPYIIRKFAAKPSQKCYSQGMENQALSYMRLTHDLQQMQLCLADGYPFVFGFTVYESFLSNKVTTSGIVPFPKKTERTVGGHAVMAVGYNDDKKSFIVRNSWGESWGKFGYFTMPYSYVTNPDLTDDFWTIRLVE